VRLAVLGTVVIVPVTWLLRRQLVASIDKTFGKTVADVVGRKEPADDVAKLLRTTLGSRHAGVLDEFDRRRIAVAFRDADPDDLEEQVCAKLAAGFRRRITTRLVLTVISVGITAFVLVYGLAWLTVARDVAADWASVSETPAAINTVDLLGVPVPLGPYVKVATLVAILAVAIFIAFVVTTGSLSAEFRDAFIETPATTALLLAVPYLAEERRLGRVPTNEPSG
jgi:hypothetical protein